jgi:hypothetical protein
MREFVVCVCNHLDHLVVLNVNEDKTNTDITIEVHLSPLPLYKRLINAVKYVFGIRSRYGDYEEVVIDKEKAIQLKNFFENALAKENFF